MDCPRKIKLPNELLSEFILCLPFNFGYPTIRVSAVFDFFLAKKQQNFRKRNEEAFTRQQEIISNLGRVLDNASEMVSVLFSEIKETKKSANIPSSRQWEALLQQLEISHNAINSLCEAQKHSHQLFKFMLFVRAASKSVAWGTPKRRLGTDDNGTSPKKAKLDGAELTEKLAGTEQTELADTAATEPLQKPGKAKLDGTELTELDGTEQTELADTAATEPLQDLEGLVAMENLEEDAVVIEPLQKPGKSKLDGAGLAEKRPMEIFDTEKETEKLAGTAETEPLAKEDGTELAEKLEGTSKTVTEPMEENPADTGMTEKPPLARKGSSFKIVDLIKEEPKQQKKL